MKRAFEFSKREQGQGLVEYALILVLVAVVVIVVLSLAGGGVSNVYCRVVKTLNSSSGCAAADAADSGSQAQTVAHNGDTCVNTITIAGNTSYSSNHFDNADDTPGNRWFEDGGEVTTRPPGPDCSSFSNFP